MANWTGMCRSSYSLVKDPAAFIRYVKMFPAFPLHSGEDENDPEAPRAFYSLADDGSIPTIYLEYVWGDDRCEEDEKLGEELKWLGTLVGEDPSTWGDQITINDFLASFLKEGEAMMILEGGHEKARYITCNGWLVHSSGEVLHVNLDTHLRERAKAAWGTELEKSAY